MKGLSEVEEEMPEEAIVAGKLENTSFDVVAIHSERQTGELHWGQRESQEFLLVRKSLAEEGTRQNFVAGKMQELDDSDEA